MTTLRHRIRAVTDALVKGQWLTLKRLHANMSEDQPSLHAVSTIVSEMVADGYLRRRGERYRYEYRSGPKKIVDRRTLNRGPAPRPLGNCALARLQRTDPKAFARMTKHDRGWRKGV